MLPAADARWPRCGAVGLATAASVHAKIKVNRIITLIDGPCDFSHDAVSAMAMPVIDDLESLPSPFRQSLSISVVKSPMHDQPYTATVHLNKPTRTSVNLCIWLKIIVCHWHCYVKTTWWGLLANSCNIWFLESVMNSQHLQTCSCKPGRAAPDLSAH